MRILLQAAPERVDLDRLDHDLREIDEVVDVHDLHVWAMSTNENALTAHLVATEDADRAALLHTIDHAMRERFAICHSTIQIEPPGDQGCVNAHPGERINQS